MYSFESLYPCKSIRIVNGALNIERRLYGLGSKAASHRAGGKSKRRQARKVVRLRRSAGAP
jgi:hypothetical protein